MNSPEECTLESAKKFFLSAGGTDLKYLSAHFERFVATVDFAMKSSCGERLLDIGCHWLHQAYFFAQRGFRITGADAPNTIQLPLVRTAAERLHISLISYRRLDLGEGLNTIPDNSIDTIIFSEIIEHLAFNPIIVWREIYRILDSGGKIIVTTPNSAYYGSIINNLLRLALHGITGIALEDIFRIGTYGHHWKEYNLVELQQYFQLLTPEFQIENFSVVTLGRDDVHERENAAKMISARNDFSVEIASKALNRAEDLKLSPYGAQIFLALTLIKTPGGGIRISPPWLVE
jgi:2-polyprenyl-3-methyl-5-hydroxy-6-metoxy-1,4-benzoquinol methylase